MKKKKEAKQKQTAIQDFISITRNALAKATEV